MPLPTPVATQADIILSPEDGSSSFSAEYAPRIAGLANGGFVAVWKDFLPIGTDADRGATLMVRRFDAEGAGVAPATAISANLVGDFEDGGAVTLGNGMVALGWGVTQDVTASRIGARIIDPATGATVGGELTVATGGGPATGLTYHGIVALSGGRAGVFYVDGDGTDRLRMTIIQADGTLGATSTILTASGPWVTATGVDDTVVALKGANADILAVVTRSFVGFDSVETLRFYNLDGSAAALPAYTLPAMNGSSMVVEALANGGVAVAYATASASGSVTLRVRLLDAAGTPIGAAPTDVTFPYTDFGTLDLVGTPDGGVVLAMAGVIGNTADSGIFGQRFTAAGATDGAIFRIDPAGASSFQSRPQLAMTGTTQFVATWEDPRNPINYDVRATRFDLNDPVPGQTLIGTNFGDTMTGASGNDILSSLRGDDRLVGNGGADSLNGGLGNDTLLGGADADTLLGVHGNDQLEGGDGADLLYGGNDNDLLIGGTGQDTLRGDAGDDTLAGQDDADFLLGGLGNDVLEGGAGNDALFGNDGADTIAGGDGGDAMDGGAGADSMAGNAGNDQGNGYAGADTLDGGTGNDNLFGGDDDDVLWGGADADRLAGEAGDDVLLGGDGNDRLDGGIGADTLSGDAGRDTLTGGSGADVFLVMSGGNDSITDFVQGEDVIDLDMFGQQMGGLDLAFLGLNGRFGGTTPGVRYVVVNDRTRIDIDSNDADSVADFSLQLSSNVALTAADFVL
jgi:Ca2+-binding RTX toxin-like protein